MKRHTKADKERFAKLVNNGCIICGNPHVEIHHLRHSGKRDHKLTIALCFAHHRNHGKGISVHDGLKSFEERYGTESELLAKTEELIA